MNERKQRCQRDYCNLISDCPVTSFYDYVKLSDTRETSRDSREEHSGASRNAEKRPTVEEVFAKYVTAIGGEAAVRKIQTRESDVSVERPKFVNPSGKPTAVHIYQKAPDKFLMVITAPDGTVSYQGYNGTTGWQKRRRNRVSCQALTWPGFGNS